MAIVLAYDDLPPGSDIRREFCDGGVKLTIPSGSVPRDLRRRVFRSAVIPAAAITSAIAVLCISGVWIFFVPERLEAELMPLALALTGVVTVAGFTLIWRVLALSMIGVLEQARRQTTVLYADRERLLVESDGRWEPHRAAWRLNRFARYGSGGSGFTMRRFPQSKLPPAQNPC